MFRHRQRDRRPPCYACKKDGSYDRSGRVTRATVRAQVPFEPYVLSLCDGHLRQLRDAFRGNIINVIRRYEPAGPE